MQQMFGYKKGCRQAIKCNASALIYYYDNKKL